ncbi:hypothetical protein L1987_83421 [Smallanthus sonchifolius]|uniref:Uncharacterized protein n=1 Tax=Smallanthus sonchifolius TaxID=185202 RepID=A0ACB8YD77_9ASTR|nr:hypothetical protein L1987_83421 [Smallanthus sonchifolius]
MPGDELSILEQIYSESLVQGSRMDALYEVREETWRLELLVTIIDNNILNWIWEDKYIFLYGGDDIEWIRKFTSNARAMATAARIPLER